MTVLVGHVEEVDPGAAGEDIRRRWRDLALARGNPFLTPEWFDSWHGLGGGPASVLAWRRDPGSGDPDAILPLIGGGRGGRALRYPGPDNGDWFGLAAAQADETDAWPALLAHLGAGRRHWRVLRLDRVPVEAAEILALPRMREPDVLPFLEFGEGGYEGWLAGRSRNFRSQLGRRRRRAEREDGFALTDTPDASALDDALARLYDLHAARRRMQGGEGVLDERARAAYSRFAHLSLERGWLRMHGLELGAETVAAWYGWRIGERYLYGISGFDPGREDLAVGTVLLGHTIERAAAEGAAVYDFLWGEESYKDRFATGRRTVETVATGAGPAARLGLAAERGARRLAARLPAAVVERVR